MYDICVALTSSGAHIRFTEPRVTSVSNQIPIAYSQSRAVKTLHLMVVLVDLTVNVRHRAGRMFYRPKCTPNAQVYEMFDLVPNIWGSFPCVYAISISRCLYKRVLDNFVVVETF